MQNNYAIIPKAVCQLFVSSSVFSSTRRALFGMGSKKRYQGVEARGVMFSYNDLSVHLPERLKLYCSRRRLKGTCVPKERQNIIEIMSPEAVFEWLRALDPLNRPVWPHF